MVAYTTLTLNNATPVTKLYNKPFVRLGPFSKIVNVETQGGFIVHDGATVNRVRIGQYSSFGCYSYVADTVMGRYCTFGSRVSVAAFSHPTDWLSIHEFQYRDVGNIYGDRFFELGTNLLQNSEKVTHIGSDVWIGDNAVVGRDLTIGPGTIIGMGAVVVKNVEPYSIVVGNPGRTLRKRFDDRTGNELLDLPWWQLSISDMSDIDFRSVRGAFDSIKRRMDAKS